MSKETISGIVTQIIGNRVRFKTRTAAVYDAETSKAQLVRKNGADMQFAEIVVGDKVTVAGTAGQITA